MIFPQLEDTLTNYFKIIFQAFVKHFNHILVVNFSETFVKMPSICCEFWCYNKKICVNKLISFFTYTDPNVNKKMPYQQLK